MGPKWFAYVRAIIKKRGKTLEANQIFYTGSYLRNINEKFNISRSCEL